MIAFNNYYTAERCEALLATDKEKNKNKKPGFMQKLMEQQQEMLAQQNGTSAYQGSASRTRGGMSKSEYNEQSRKAINEARKIIDAKYSDDDTEDSSLEAARRRMAEKYGDDID